MKLKPAPAVVLISGRGSNLQAIIDETRERELPIELRAVISNNPSAPGLRQAQAAGVPACIVDHHRFTTRAEFDDALIKAIDAHHPQLVALAGFMRVLGTAFIDHYAERLMNIHPSLLPQFPGLKTHARALAAGVAEHGATVHFVTRDVDAGPVIIQARVPVLAQDTPDTLAARVLEQEHRIYPLAIRWFAEGRLSVREDKVLLDGQRQAAQGLIDHN